MSVLLSRAENLRTITVALHQGMDGQGMPSYADPVSVQAHVVREDSMGVTSEGSEVKTHLTVYYPPNQGAAPGEGDRVTDGDESFIGVEAKTAQRPNGVVSHTRLKCRRE